MILMDFSDSIFRKWAFAVKAGSDIAALGSAVQARDVANIALIAMVTPEVEQITRKGELKIAAQVIVTASIWPAPGSEDTKFGVTMGLEVGHGEAEVYTGVQA